MGKDYKKVIEKAGNKIIFEIHREQVERALLQAAISALYAAAGKVTSAAKSNSPVDTGQLKNSWTYKVDEEKLQATIGSPLENAIWNEFGTGEFALHGDGRKGGWHYKDQKGKWHYTFGKKPHRTLQIAFNQNQGTIKRIIEDEMRKAMNSTNGSNKSAIASALKEISAAAKNGKEKAENVIGKVKDETDER